MNYLDYKRDADPPTGTVVVESEREFMRLALSTNPLLVRGKKLCEWAETYWMQRGIQFTKCASFSDEVSVVCDELLPAHIATLLEKHSGLLKAQKRPLTLLNMLDALFPEDIWHQPTSLQHAARWLLWLHRIKPHEYIQPLLRSQTAIWRQIADNSLKRIYEVTSPEEAYTVLCQWLRIERPYLSIPDRAFPLIIPTDLRENASNQWRIHLIKTNGAFFQELSREKLPAELTVLAATLCCDFYEHHPELLTEINLRQLRPHLPDEKTEKLRMLLRPPTPAPIPTIIEDIFKWFLNSYLPYREWSILVGSKPDIIKTNLVAKDFALQFLDHYPRLIMGETTYISFQKAGQLRERKTNEVTIYVILDGLNVPDSFILLKQITAKSSRLTVLHNELCFAPIPTITPNCKPALKRGYTPRIAATDTSLDPAHVKILPEKKDPIEWLKQARPGDLFIWSILEPDETYHSKGYDLTTLKKTVTNLLSSIAERVVNASLLIPDDKKTRIVISTDHGRLLNSSNRCIQVPDGMHSHQRAATGTASITFPPNGLLIQNDNSIAFLNNHTFHTVDDSAIVIGEDCFVMEDGKSGMELFPHGGVSPEEVIIPWIEIGRDVEMPKIICKIIGSGQEGTEGEISITVENPSSLALTVINIEITFGQGYVSHIALDRFVMPWSRLTHELKIKPWPSESQIVKSTAKMIVTKPDGDEFTITPELFLQVKGFQKRTDILDDLL